MTILNETEVSYGKQEQRNNATTQQRNNATTQQRNNATTQQRGQAAGGKRLTSTFLLAVAALLPFAPLEQSQAQLYLDIFPSQDSTNNTLWVFSGSSTGWTHSNAGPYIRRSGASYNRKDTHKTSSALLRNTAPALYALTPVVTSSTTNAPLDFESLRTRLGQTFKFGTTNTNDDITIPSSATNAPTLTYTGIGSRTIANMFLNDVSGTGWDDIGVRVSGSSDLNYGSTSRAVNWIGAGTMAKPIGHFHITTPGSFNGNRPPGSGSILGSWTGAGSNNLRIRVHSAVIPEPEEYALVFGLFALAFVLFRRHRQKKQQQVQATAS